MSVVCARKYEDKIIMAADSILCQGDMNAQKGMS